MSIDRGARQHCGHMPALAGVGGCTVAYWGNSGEQTQTVACYQGLCMHSL